MGISSIYSLSERFPALFLNSWLPYYLIEKFALLLYPSKIEVKNLMMIFILTPDEDSKI